MEGFTHQCNHVCKSQRGQLIIPIEVPNKVRTLYEVAVIEKYYQMEYFTLLRYSLLLSCRFLLIRTFSVSICCSSTITVSL